MILKRIACAALSLALIFAPAAPTQGNENILRLHIIANSDDAPDQQVKLAVRDAVLALEADMAGCADSDGAKALLMADGEKILETVENTLRKNGMDYGAQLMIGVFDFPDRTYGEAFYPAGRYEALRIVLGEGKGHNWWCVMFPPLCILELPGGKIDYEGLDADIEIGQLKLSSFLVKLLKSIDGGKLWKTLNEK